MADPAVPPIVSLSYDEPEQMAEVMALHDLDVLVLSRATRAWQHVTVRLGPLTLDWGYTPARILARGAASSEYSAKPGPAYFGLFCGNECA